MFDILICKVIQEKDLQQYLKLSKDSMYPKPFDAISKNRHNLVSNFIKKKEVDIMFLTEYTTGDTTDKHKFNLRKPYKIYLGKATKKIRNAIIINETTIIKKYSSKDF